MKTNFVNDAGRTWYVVDGDRVGYYRKSSLPWMTLKVVLKEPLYQEGDVSTEAEAQQWLKDNYKP